MSRNVSDTSSNSTCPRLWLCDSHIYETVKSDENGQRGQEANEKTNDQKKHLTRLCVVLCCILIACWLLGLCMNFIFRSSAVSALDMIFGVQTSVAGLDVSLPSARAELDDIILQNPDGMVGHAMRLDRVVVDCDVFSLLHQPIHLQVMSLMNLHINMLQLPGSKSNLETIIGHAIKVFHDDSTLAQKIDKFQKFRNNPTRMLADKVDFKNITVTSNITGLTAHHHVRQVLLTKVGQQQNGIRIFEFLETMLRALIHAVAESGSREMQRGLVNAVEKTLDIGSISVDVGGGLVEQSAKMLGNTSATVGKAVVGAIANVASMVGHKKWGQKAKSWVGNATSNMSKDLRKFGSAAKNWLGNTAERMENTSGAIKNKTSGQRAPVETAAKGIGKKVGGFFKNATSNVSKGFDKFGNETKAAAKGVGKQVGGFFKNLFKKAQ